MNPHHQHKPESNPSIRTAFFLNLGFTLIEILGGIYTNSLAILSDALHDLGDSLSIGLAWFLESQSRKPSRGQYSYGFRRLSLLAALTNALVLIGGSAVIITQAIPRLIKPQSANAQGMLALAILGILVNGAAAHRLRGGKSLNIQVLAWHLLEDVLGWAAVLVVSITLLITEVKILDPLLSILITLYILYNVLHNLWKTTAIFLQAAPSSLDLQAIDQGLASIPQVLSTHHTHIWSLDGEHHVLTTHLVVQADASKAELIEVKKAALLQLGEIGLAHITIAIEFEDEDCQMRDD